MPFDDFCAKNPILRSEILQKHVVHVTRIFNQRVKSFITNIILRKHSGSIPVKFYTYRVEMQLRGMAHIHGCLWLDPLFLESLSHLEEKARMCHIIEQFVTCELPHEADPFYSTVSEVQTHNHTKNCRRKTELCRFGYPRLPSEQTIIAVPIESTDQPGIAEKLKILEKAKSLISSPNPPKTFEDFFSRLQVSRELYHEALSLSKKGKVVVLKRRPNETHINNYNKQWLQAWNANMDIQFCCDTYAVVTYICDYYSKDETGITDLMKRALKDCSSQSQEESVKTLKNLYLSHRQIGACEATYRLLPHLNLKDSNISTIFVTTGFPENRYNFLRYVKPEDVTDLTTVQIEGREGDYVWTETIHEKYCRRPETLESMCLAEFAINYTTVVNKPTNLPPDVSLSAKPTSIRLKNGGLMRLREQPCVLRLHDAKRKSENHECVYSECLLFLPWRDELSDLFRYNPVKSVELYNESKEILERNKLAIFPMSNEEEFLQKCLSVESGSLMRPQHIADSLDPQGEQMNEDEDEEMQNITFDFRHPGTALPEPSQRSSIPALKVLDRGFICETIRSLDTHQCDVFNCVASYIHGILRGNKPSPPLLIVQGEAGTGKTKLINCVISYANSEFTQAGSKLDRPSSVVVAPTGMAASLVNGTTLHSLFQLNFGDELLPLTDSSLDNLRSSLEELKLLIVDEMSMVRADLLYQLHERLQQIKQCSQVFGGVTVLLCGDLLQLKPVRGRFIFETPRCSKYADLYDICNLWDLFQPVVLQSNHRLINFFFARLDVISCHKFNVSKLFLQARVRYSLGADFVANKNINMLG